MSSTVAILAMLVAAGAVDDESMADVLADLERDPRRLSDAADQVERTHLTNREKRLRAYIDDDGTLFLEDRVDPGAYPRAGLFLEGFTAAGPPELDDDLVVVPGVGVTQYFMNTSGGIQQVFEVDEEAGRAHLYDGEELILRLRATGLTPTRLAHDAIQLNDDAGARIRYDGLVVFDADHQRLAAWFDAIGDIIEIHVETGGARWPITVDPIATSIYDSTTGATGDLFGAAVASAALTNAQSDDLVVGAPAFDGGFTNQGAVLIFFGSSTGLGVPDTYTIGSSYANFGAGVALGDIDDDGDIDIVAGASGQNRVRFILNGGNGSFTLSSTVLNPGVSGCWPGENGGIAVADVAGGDADDIILRCDDANSTLIVWNGGSGAPPDTTKDTQFSTFLDGVAVAAGNVNPTGTPSAKDDIAVAGADRIRIYKGSALDAVSSSGETVLLGATSSNSLNTAALLDANGDGAADLLVGESGYNSNRGRARLFLSNGTSISSTASSTLAGASPGTSVGSAVGGGDVNADGRADPVVCGRVQDAPGNKGQCHLYRGLPVSGVSFTENPRLLVDGATDENLGWFMGTIAVGDFRGDGGGDLILGAPRYDNGGSATTNAGRVLLYDGDRANVKTTYLVALERNDDYSSFGETVVLADVNSDGRDDVLVGAPDFDAGGTQRGAVFGYAGGTSISSTPSWTQLGTQNDGQFGTAIAVGHFRDHGSPPVVAVGAPGEGTANQGRVYLYNASSRDFPADNASYDQIVVGKNDNDLLGDALANTGSLSNTVGDGLAIGAPEKQIPPINGGYLLLYRATGGAMIETQRFNGYDSGIGCVTFGTYLANAGNVANGYRDDLLVGAPSCSSGHTEEGKAFLITSGSGTTASLTSWTFEGNQSDALLGVVAGLGDATGDGIDDFAVGAPYLDTNSVDNGRVFVFKGVASGLPSTNKVVSMSTSFSSHCGSAIAGRHDFNRDGLMDMVVGEPSYDETNQANEGRVRVFFGKPGTMDYNAARVFEGGCVGCRLGAAVAAGDVNGDGYGDIALGRPGFTNGQTEEGDVRVYVGAW